MDLSFLQSLLLVVDSGSLAQAARTQQLTGAALRQRVAALERELGVKLLTRSGHTSLPTQACTDLLPRARHMLREFALMKEDIDTDAFVQNWHQPFPFDEFSAFERALKK